MLRELLLQQIRSIQQATLSPRRARSTSTTSVLTITISTSCAGSRSRGRYFLCLRLWLLDSPARIRSKVECPDESCAPASKGWMRVCTKSVFGPRETGSPDEIAGYSETEPKRLPFETESKPWFLNSKPQSAESPLFARVDRFRVAPHLGT